MDKLDSWLKKTFVKNKKTNSTQKTTSDFNKRGFDNKKAKQNVPNKAQKNNAPKSGQKNSFVNVFKKGSLRIIPVGGLNEVGKNMMALEYGNDIIIIDMGLEFPDEDMLGIDYVIPDVTYLEENRHKIRGVIFTHGHLDHIGGAPYILPKLNYPLVFGPRLAIELINKKLEEFKIKEFVKTNVVDSKDVLKLGQFKVEFFRVTHSIPDSFGVVVTSPEGKIVHTGDFKFDDTPTHPSQRADIDKIEALGRQNVFALFSDSTNALKSGHTMSEKQVSKTLEEIIQRTDKRLIITSFSSLVGRIQEIIKFAEKYNRKVFISGRSMRDTVEIAKKIGYITHSEGAVQDIKKYKNYPDEKTLIITTGSQGESISALSRMALGTHSHIKIKKGDTVVLSSSPIIGNELAITTVINKLCMLGAKVINKQIMDVHTSGHGHREELKKMINFVKPKYFIPIHGLYFMRQEHALLAQECGIPEDKTIMIENGNILEAHSGNLEVSKKTIETKYILIDGSGEGKVGSNVQEERMMMSQNGSLIIIVTVDKRSKKLKGNIEVISRGFMYTHEHEEINKEIKKLTDEAFRKLKNKDKNADNFSMKRYIKNSIDKYTHKRLERHPLIVPIIIEV